MTDNLPTREPAGGNQIADAGWISGAMSARPGFNPSFLVLCVRDLLTQRGIPTHAEPGSAATNAASDLLRALGVEPQSSPWRAQGAER